MLPLSGARLLQRRASRPDRPTPFEAWPADFGDRSYPEALIEAMRSDKKRVKVKPRWVLPRELGEVTIVREDS